MADIGHSNPHVVIVGAGQGGGAVAAFLRQFGHQGEITLIGEEFIAPYQRPPLSKAWLKGDLTTAGLAIRPDTFFVQQSINLKIGVQVAAINAEARSIELSSGAQINYDYLVLATGARARMLPEFSRFSNVFTLRTLEDAKRLRQALGSDQRLIVIGGGYVGLECAATAREQGTEVVILEKMPRLLQRVASSDISSFLQRYHEHRGVELVCDANIASIAGDDRAKAVRLKDGREFHCDSVLIGVGASPASELAVAAGIKCDDGIAVDDSCRTSNPYIFAIGDVANRPHPLYARRLRIESIPSCNEQAKRVAAVLMGRECPRPEVPWFWSDQYDLKLQMAGLPFDVDNVVVRGDVGNASFAVYHLSQGRVVAVETINSAADFMAGKKLIGTKKVVDAATISDTAISVQDFAN